MYVGFVTVDVQHRCLAIRGAAARLACTLAGEAIASCSLAAYLRQASARGGPSAKT